MGQDLAFQTLKTKPAISPVLKLPDMDEEFVLQTDASNEGLGEVLLQSENEVMMPVRGFLDMLCTCICYM